jgi:hypothetical protein
VFPRPTIVIVVIITATINIIIIIIVVVVTLLSSLAGCSPGWNLLLQRMDSEGDLPWALMVNNDIQFPPGSGEGDDDDSGHVRKYDDDGGGGGGGDVVHGGR